jgi:hypothetical protein
LDTPSRFAACSRSPWSRGSRYTWNGSLFMIMDQCIHVLINIQVAVPSASSAVPRWVSGRQTPDAES